MDIVEIKDILEEILDNSPCLAEKIAHAYKLGPNELEDVLDEYF